MRVARNGTASYLHHVDHISISYDPIMSNSSDQIEMALGAAPIHDPHTGAA
jgi:hypothetical protein